ncbi:MAG: LacI family DNA-binding transcriptional regulator [Bacteroidota bacterium]|nr:LacI family DNA-binding transcriptional regulator [Bacteroidota bacterium]
MQESVTRETFYNISLELYVATSTVSPALQRHYVIDSSTKAAVYKIVKKLSYYPNNLAFSIRPGKVKSHWVFTVSSKRLRWEKGSTIVFLFVK